MVADFLCWEIAGWEFGRSVTLLLLGSTAVQIQPFHREIRVRDSLYTAD
jgi:hypothetical protein